MTAPLTERFRPQTLSGIVGHPDIVDRLQSFVDRYHDGDAGMHHLLFVGPAGVGKTSAAFALAADLYGDDHDAYTLSLNASDDRGIDTVRGRIKDFAKRSALGEQFNLIVLDEADHLTPDAQAALRRTMEDFSRTTRFILIANYPHRIIAPIRDRCATYHFAPLDADVAADALAMVCKTEGIAAEHPALIALAKACDGSLRRALNQLEALPQPIRVEHIRAPDEGRAKAIVADVLAGDTRKAEKALLQWMRSGATADDVCAALFDVLDAGGVKDKALWLLGDYEWRISQGANPEIQMRAYLRHLGSVIG